MSRAWTTIFTLAKISCIDPTTPLTTGGNTVAGLQPGNACNQPCWLEQLQRNPAEAAAESEWQDQCAAGIDAKFPAQSLVATWVTGFDFPAGNFHELLQHRKVDITQAPHVQAGLAHFMLPQLCEQAAFLRYVAEQVDG